MSSRTKRLVRAEFYGTKVAITAFMLGALKLKICWFRWFVDWLVQTEKAFDGSQKTGRFLDALLGGLQGTGREVGLALGYGPTDRFGEAGVSLEDVFHRGVTYLKHLCFFKRHDVCGPRFSGEQRHLAKKITFG
jgi:hypothetical protein